MANVFYPEKTPAASFVQPAKPSQQECINYFVSFLRQFDVFANSDFEEVIPMLKYTHWKKNQPVFEVGKVHTYMNFVVSGAFEFYAEDQHGRSIIGFLTACNFCSPIYNFFSRQPSTEGVLCVEESYGLQISLDHFILLMQRPDFAAFFRQMNHHLLDYYSQRIKAFQAMSARERYEVLLKENPDIFNRFPLQDIARYLGVQPETLSRIRNEKKKS